MQFTATMTEGKGTLRAPSSRWAFRMALVYLWLQLLSPLLFFASTLTTLCTLFVGLVGVITSLVALFRKEPLTLKRSFAQFLFLILIMINVATYITITLLALTTR